jgi:hypothetical protein
MTAANNHPKSPTKVKPGKKKIEKPPEKILDIAE